MKLILLGAPGAGKGTQAEIISEKLHIPTISTGNILREAIKNGTETGLKAKSFMDAGKLVPDDVIIGIVSERVAAPDCANGFILDGVPRTIPQAEALEAAGIHFDCVVSIEIADSVIESRMTGRRVCGSCGASYHVTAHPPKQEGICDLCGKELSPHTGGKATCTAKAECEVCGEPYGELDAHNHADWRHVEAKAATEEAAGNIEYWYCAACGAYFADEAGAQPITEKDTVITQLEPTKPTATTTKPTVAPSQPQTGDSGHPLLWFALLFVSGGVLTGAAALGKKKKDSVE